MSLKMIGLSYEADLTPSEKWILNIIGNYANPEGRGCWASYDRLSRMSGLSRRQVIRIVSSLEKNGYIKFIGNHPQFGTNIWDIEPDNIPMLPPFQEWLRRLRKKDEDGPEEIFPNASLQGGDTMSPPSAVAVTLCHPPSDTMSPPPVTPCHPASDMVSPNPSSDPSDYESVRPPAFAGNGFTLSGNWLEAPVNERPSIDDQTTYGPDDEEIDALAKQRPKTDLERQIIHFCYPAKSITDGQRMDLRQTVTTVHGKSRPVTYPSPEDEWKKNPDLFAEYVATCAAIAKENNHGRNPGRSTLINLIRRYGRPKTGWFDFRDFESKAAEPMKQAEDKVYRRTGVGAWEQ